MKDRLGGLVLLAIGVFITYLCVLKPLSDAKEHADSVSLSLKGAFICPVLVVFGLLLLVLGEDSRPIIGTRDEPKFAGMVIGVVLLAAGGLLYMWTKGQIEAYGYAFEH